MHSPNWAASEGAGQVGGRTQGLAALFETRALRDSNGSSGAAPCSRTFCNDRNALYLSTRAATSHMWLLSTCYEASVTEKLNFKL